jgi:hypothetical protein
MAKERLYTTPSSLGSYFGVGFNSPEEQIQIDLGLVTPEFDDDSKARMLLGRTLEDSVLNYFEEAMNIKITDRNDNMMLFYDGKIKGKMDGLTTINGKKTVVEAKVSNASYGVFTENKGYILQCQAYMLATEAEQTMLCGLYQGKPVYKLIQRDEEIIQDIKDITDFIVNVLMGLDDFDNYPTEILEKYSNYKPLPTIEELSDEELNDLSKLATYKEEEKRLKKKIKVIDTKLKENYDEGIYEDDRFKVTVSNRSRKGGFDESSFSIEHPDLELTKYRKPDTYYKVLSVKTK